jgi:hypothetical protein
MSEIHQQVAEQLRRELGAVAASVIALFGSDLVETVELRLHDRSAMLAANLCGEDDVLAGRTVSEVMPALFPNGDPPPDWWRTPLGRVVARSFGDDGEAVTQSVAAAMLGVTRSTVAQMLYRADKGLPGAGGLERHPDGGITRASVLARLAYR